MTNEEAIRFASSLMDNSVVNDNDLEAFCDMAIEALEKQVPKKPEHVNEAVVDKFCPRCKARVGKYQGCFNNMIRIPSCECGQRLDWSDDND